MCIVWTVHQTAARFVVCFWPFVLFYSLIFLFQIYKIQCEDKVLFLPVHTKFSVGENFNQIFSAITVFLRNIVPVLGTIATTGLLVQFVQKKKKKLNQSLSGQEKQSKQISNHVSHHHSNLFPLLRFSVRSSFNCKVFQKRRTHRVFLFPGGALCKCH